MKPIIEIKNLYKSFGEVKAVNDLSFTVKEGELFAFLGVNGAGKSTTISILCGLLKKDNGTVVINGLDIDKEPEQAKLNLGVVFQNSVLDKNLTVYDNLECRAAVHGIVGEDFKERLNELVCLLDFGGFLNRNVGKLSGGQRRKVDIARALLHNPKILVLDEPTTGLDPQTRRTLWDVIDKLRKEQGTTVFLTTHYMEEAADADYIVILDNGEVCASGTPLELKNEFVNDRITIYNVDDKLLDTLGLKYEKNHDAVCISVESTAVATELIVAHPELFNDYEITKGKMDDVFLAATGKTLLGGEAK